MRPASRLEGVERTVGKSARPLDGEPAVVRREVAAAPRRAVSAVLDERRRDELVKERERPCATPEATEWCIN